jgi:hypothetical protein
MSRQIKGERLNATDFYATPPWCYENLEIDWSLFDKAHEPCSGDGRIQFFLEEDCGLTCSYSEILEGKDFFEWTDSTDLILTNPPFSLAKEFIDHSLKYCNTCIMLLRINYLGSIGRHDWWKENTPTALHVLSKRPSFTGKGTDATDYAWYVWDATERLNRGIFFVTPPTKEQNTFANDLAKELYSDS